MFCATVHVSFYQIFMLQHHTTGCCCAEVSPLGDFVLPLKAWNVFSCVVYLSQLLAVQRWCIERLAETGIFVKEVKYHSRMEPLYWKKEIYTVYIRLERNVVQREMNFRKTRCACLKWTLRSSAGRLALRSSHLWTPNFELSFSLNVQRSVCPQWTGPVNLFGSEPQVPDRSGTERPEHLSRCGAAGAHLYEYSPFGSLYYNARILNWRPTSQIRATGELTWAHQWVNV